MAEFAKGFATPQLRALGHFMNSSISCCVFMLSAMPFAIAQSDSDPNQPNSPGAHLFESALKVVQIQMNMSGEQFDALTPSGATPFGPAGLGAPPSPTEDIHRNTFGVQFPWTKGDLTLEGETLKDVGFRYKGNYTFMATARSLKKSGWLFRQAASAWRTGGCVKAFSPS